MLATVLVFVLVVGIGAIGYTYLGYPLMLLVGGWLLPAEPDPERYADRWPSVTMVVPVHNEVAVVGDKVENVAATEYPGPFRCLFVSDSTDGTDERLRATMTGKMDLLALPERRGKSHAINRALERIDSGVVVFSDANTMYEPGTVREVVAPLADDGVGCVTGRLRLLDADDETTEGAYWRYELWLRRLESRLGTTVGVNGGIMAARRESLSPLPEDALVDDLELALSQARAGRRVHYAPDAVATEYTTGSVGEEFDRRVRIGAGNVRALVRYADLLDPRRGRVAFVFWSHKVLRWLVPWLLVAVLVANAALVTVAPMIETIALLAVQLAGYAVSAVGLASRRARANPLFRVAAFFVAMNSALALGLLRSLTGRTEDIWNETTRRQ